MQFVPGKSDAYNAGWESFFIDRELSDNPHSAGSEPYSDGMTALMLLRPVPPTDIGHPEWMPCPMTPKKIAKFIANRAI